MTAQAVQLLTPTGRIVWGSLYVPRDKDFDGNPLVIKNGPDAGKPRISYEFGLAIKKGGETHWASTPWGAPIWATGHGGHPVAAQRTDFAWKVQDGDSTQPNKRGNKNCDNPDYVGHWILSFSSSFAPKIVNADGSAYITEPNAVKPGYFVQVAGTVVPNEGASPGVYLNHSVVALQGYGPEISTGPDPKTLGFGKSAAPPGMSAVPLPSMTAPPAAVPAPAPIPAAIPPPPPAPAAAVPVAPHPGFVPAPTAPPPPPSAAPPPPPPPPAAGPTMTAKATTTYAAYRAGGWSDEQLRANGLML